MMSKSQHRPNAIAVVIPTYNRSSTIERAIISCISQDLPPTEVLVVDDHSRDTDARLTKEICERFKNVIYLQNSEKKGAQGARNTGIRFTNCDWICFLDSDDYFLPTSISSRLAIALEKAADVCHSDCLVRRDNAESLFGVPPVEGIEAYRSLLRSPGPVFPGLLAKRNALVKIGYLDESIISYQEWDTSIRLAKSHVFAYCRQPTFVYDCTGSDTISKDMLRDVRGYRQIVRKHLLEILRECGPSSASQHMLGIARRCSAIRLAPASAMFYFFALLVGFLTPKYFVRQGFPIAKALLIQTLLSVKGS